MTTPVPLAPVPIEELPPYPIGPDDRLDSHYFVAWERRRWLNSDMRLKGDPVARAIYLDLIWISYEQSPTGTLPDDMEMLAKLAMIEVGTFTRLAAMPFGPLHKWTRCQIEGTGEIRLHHPMVTRTILEAKSRKEDNRARTEAANLRKRLQRLREVVTGYDAKMGANDAAILFMDGWLNEHVNGNRTAQSVQRAMMAWANHQLDRNMRGRSDV